MKTKTLTTAFALAAQILTGAAAHATSEGGHGGNGGGLINRNGRLMTFYSAGFYTEPVEATSDEVPQLSAVMRFFNTTKMLSEMTKVKFSNALMPSPTRQYFKVKETSFTPEVRANLMAVYGRQMKVDANQIAIGAITDTQSGTTYLLPSFYKLQPIEQQAILFHEAYWMVNPTTDYQTVVQAEMAFQAYMANPNSPERLLRWANYTGTTTDVLKASITTDLQTNSMKGLVKGKSQIIVGDLLGAQFIGCVTAGQDESCKAFISTNLYALTQRYPNSLFLRFVQTKVSQNKYNVVAVREDYPGSLEGICQIDQMYTGWSNCSGGTAKQIASFARTPVELSSVGYSTQPKLTVGHGFIDFR